MAGFQVIFSQLTVRLLCQLLITGFCHLLLAHVCRRLRPQSTGASHSAQKRAFPDGAAWAKGPAPQGQGAGNLARSLRDNNAEAVLQGRGGDGLLGQSLDTSFSVARRNNWTRGVQWTSTVQVTGALYLSRHRSGAPGSVPEAGNHRPRLEG